MKRFNTRLGILVAIVLSLSACSQKKTDDESEAKAAVRVNGQSISSAELNAKVGNSQHGSLVPISSAIMKMTVDTELLRQAAIQEKLDADVEVRASLANSNRMILASVYIKKKFSAIGSPSESDIGDFYKKNPERFSDRKQYDMQVFGIQCPPDKEANVLAQFAKSNKPEAFDQWLTLNNVPHNISPTSVAGDQLPDEVLQKIKNVTAGGTVILDRKGQINVAFVINVQKQPVPLSDARSSIVNTISEARQREVMSNLMKQLHDKAKIEYVSPFTESGFSPPATQH